jgi:hypothetical protein
MHLRQGTRILRRNCRFPTDRRIYIRRREETVIYAKIRKLDIVAYVSDKNIIMIIVFFSVAGLFDTFKIKLFKVIIRFLFLVS